MKNKKILIIGSNSFLGSSFVRFLQKFKELKILLVSRSDQLEERFRPYSLENKNIFFKKIDINKNLKKIIILIKNYKPDFIINYAAQSMVGQSWQNPQDWLLTNSLTTVKLYIEISKLKLKTKLIHISTPEIYGHTKHRILENELYSPSTPYALSRVNADLSLNMLKKEFGLKYISIRASNIYGEYQKIFRLIPGAVTKFLNKKHFYLDGNGHSKRSFLHVDDLSNATYLLMKNFKSGEIYHISSNVYVSIKNIVLLIAKKMNANFSKQVIIKNDRKGKDKFYYLNSSKIKKLGWRPNISLEEGIDRVIFWAKKYQNKFTHQDYLYKHKR
jgi:dTDP-glucose 4,6-dehydratase